MMCKSKNDFENVFTRWVFLSRRQLGAIFVKALEIGFKILFQ